MYVIDLGGWWYWGGGGRSAGPRTDWGDGGQHHLSPAGIILHWQGKAQGNH